MFIYLRNKSTVVGLHTTNITLHRIKKDLVLVNKKCYKQKETGSGFYMYVSLLIFRDVHLYEEN